MKTVQQSDKAKSNAQVYSSFTMLELQEFIQDCYSQSPKLDLWCEQHDSLRMKELRPLLHTWLKPKHQSILDKMSDDQILWAFIEVLKRAVDDYCSDEKSPIELLGLIDLLHERVIDLEHSMHLNPSKTQSWFDQILNELAQDQDAKLNTETEKQQTDLWVDSDLVPSPLDYPSSALEAYEEAMPPEEDLADLSLLSGGVGGVDERIPEPRSTDLALPRAPKKEEDSISPLPPVPAPPRSRSTDHIITEAPPALPSQGLYVDSDSDHFGDSASQYIELEEAISKQSPKAKISRVVDRELTQPGPLERLLERVRTLSWLCYLLMGYSALYLLNLIDNLWSLFSEYVTRAFNGLMGLRSALKVAEWRSSGQLDVKLLESAYQTLALSERLLCLPPLSNELLNKASVDQTLEPNHIASLQGHHPLSLALSARSQLDDLRRNLNQLRPKAGRRHFWGAVKNFVVDLIPNPLSFIRPWINTVMLVWKLNFSRKQVHEVHSSLLEHLIALSELIKLSNQKHKPTLNTSAGESYLEQEVNSLVDKIEEEIYLLLTLTLQSRYHAQPHRWSLFDQLGELSIHRQKRVHPWAQLELRGRLLKELVKHEDYKESEALENLLVTQRTVQMLRRYRTHGLI